jgi:outer membrane protein TolC
LALSNRLDYAQALDDVQSARRASGLSRRNLLPDIALLVRAERSGLGREAEPAVKDPFDDRIFAGLSWRGDWTGTRERWAAREAELAETGAEDSLRVRERLIARDVLRAIDRYRTARSRHESAEQAERMAAARARLAQRLLDAGRLDSEDALNSEIQHIESVRQTLAAASDASVAAYEYLRAVGTLTDPPPDLKPTVLLTMEPAS